MRTIITLFILAAASLTLTAQGLTLTSKSKKKSFPINHELKISVSKEFSKLRTNAYYGKLLRVNDDSITLKPRVWIYNVKNKDGRYVMHEHYYESSEQLPDEIKIAKFDIYEIENIHSLKRIKSRKTRSRLGAALLVAGVVSALNGLVVKNKSDKNTLFISGGIGFGVGLILGATSGTPEYNTWKEWKIE